MTSEPPEGHEHLGSRGDLSRLHSLEYGGDEEKAWERLPYEYVEMYRGMCLGECPVYEVRFERTGWAYYTGEHFVERIGKHWAELSFMHFAGLCYAIQELGFFEEDPEPSTPILDASGTTVSVAARGGSPVKTVSNQLTPTPSFWVVETLMDGIAESLTWHLGDGD